MDLNLTDEQVQFEESFRKFCVREIAPQVDATEQSGVPSSTFEKLGAAGYLGLLHSECYGGQDASAVTAVLAQAILSYYCGSTFFSTGASAGLFALPIKYAGSDAQKEKYLPSIISGASIGCLAVTEAGAGSDVSALQATLRPVAGGGYRLDGQKAYITNAPTADYALVLARLCRGSEIPRGPSSLTLCIVDLKAPGINRGKPLSKLGLRGSPTGELFFDGVVVGEDALLGRPGSGFRQTMQAFDWERLSMSAYCVGVMQACMDESRRYSRQRKAFGRIIAKHQSVAFMLADIKTRLQASRLMLMETAWLFDRAAGASRINHNGRTIEITARASELKLMTSQYARECTNLAVQIHGGAGYMEEFKVARLYRDIKIAEIGGGTSEIQKQIVARSEARHRRKAG